MFLIDPSALLFASLLAGLMAVGVVALAHGATEELHHGVAAWLLGDVALCLGRLLLLLQPGTLHSQGLPGLEPATVTIVNATLVVAAATLHTLALRAALTERPHGRAAWALLLVPAYALLAPALPSHALRLAMMITLAVGCMLWTLRVVWPHRRQFRGAWLISVTMLLFLAGSAAAMVNVFQAPPATLARQLLPPLPALVLDLASALAMTLGFILLLFERMQHKIKLLSSTDALTGAMNRRGFMHQLDLQVTRARRERQPLSLAIFDLDHFKAVNDRHGHAMGDAVLVGFVQRMRHCARDGDVLGRWGGEEFVLLMPGTAPAQALQVAERLRAAVAAAPLADGAPVVTVSGGVTGTHALPADLPHDQLIHRADANLYRAKRTRNCMRVEEAALAA